MKRIFGGLFILCAVVLVGGCGGDSSDATDAAETAEFTGKRLDVYFDAKSGSELTGIAMFVKNSQGVTLQLNLETTPPGEHAVHIHDVGDCSADDASSAGGHWNPKSMDHGKWGEAPHHLGDIGNITVGEDGKGSLTFATDLWSLGGAADNDVYGKSIIVHAAPDDFTSQPTGAAGGRIGCVVISQ